MKQPAHYICQRARYVICHGRYIPCFNVHTCSIDKCYPGIPGGWLVLLRINEDGGPVRMDIVGIVDTCATSHYGTRQM